MSISQADIDALLSSAGDLVDSVEGGAEDAPKPEPASASPSPSASPQSQAQTTAPPVSFPSEIGRILRMKVPVIVTLAERRSSVSSVLGLTAGSIIEFEIPSDSDLKLTVSNKCIGTGHAVKVGENFGLRITTIGAVNDRIKALGPE